MKNFPEFMFGSVLVALCLIGLYVSVSALRSDGRIDYCYVQTNPETHTSALWGHVPWGNNRQLVSGVTSTDQALNEAAKFGCKIQ